MKAILVLDEMPDICINCPLCDPYNDCCATGEDVIEYETGRPEFCPLRPMPEPEPEDYSGFTTGWNNCLETIGGSGEDA